MRNRKNQSSLASRSLARVIFFSSLLAGGASAQVTEPASYSLDGADLVASSGTGEAARLPLGCQGVGLLSEGARIYVACGQDGAVIAEQRAEGLQVVGRISGAGDVTGFFVQGGRVWATSTRIEARPIDELTDAASPRPARITATAPPAAASSPALEAAAPSPAERSLSTDVGEVLEVSAQSAVVSIGIGEGLVVGSRVEIYEVHQEDLGGGVQAMAEDRLIVAEVTAVGDARSRVALGMNETVPVGALVRAVDAPLTRSRMNPPRAGGFLELGVGIRPFIPLGEAIGLGFLGDLSVTYRGQGPWFVSTSLAPVAFSVTKAEDSSVVGWNVSAGYDHRLVELGVGIGMVRYTDVQYSSGGYTNSAILALTLSQSARFGALDGLHFWMVSQIMLHDEDAYNARRFEWSGMTGRFQIPVYDYTWLVFEGGGGETGERWGEVGLKLTIRGDGNSGTVFVTPSIGVAALTNEVDTAIGPMIGVSVDWRL